MYKVVNLFILDIKHYIFCKYNFIKILNICVLFRLITERIYVEKYSSLKIDEYPQYEKHWGKNAIFLIIIEQNLTYS